MEAGGENRLCIAASERQAHNCSREKIGSSLQQGKNRLSIAAGEKQAQHCSRLKTGTVLQQGKTGSVLQ